MTPRRAPSPGMAMLGRQMPSGPGSLPGLIIKRRLQNDDGANDVSSSVMPNSMLEYAGSYITLTPHQ